MTDDFEIMGSWWLPENENRKIPGLLKFVAEKEIELELMSSFDESQEQFFEREQPQYFDIILGESNGHKITLLRSQEKNRNGGSVGDSAFRRSSFHCDYIIKGIHFLSLDDIKFARMSVNFTYLEDWISPNPFVYEEQDGMDVIRYVNPPSHDIKIEKINSVISIVSSETYSNDFKTVSMSVHSAFIIKPIAESKDLGGFRFSVG